jgi:formamidopyrimidine-DNA glycosylase
MPELPEITVLARQMKTELVGKTGIVSYAHLTGQRSVYTFGAKGGPSATTGNQ